jgi:hypothetical protein
MTLIGTPHMSKKDREKVHKDLHRQAYPTTHNEAPIGPKDLARILGAANV